jgi:hypothetical protein
MRLCARPFLLLLPVLLWLAYIAFLGLGRKMIEADFRPVRDIVWQGAGGALSLQSEVDVQGEQHQYRLSVRQPDGRILLRRSVLIDWDMGGGGFVAAMQVDADPELEWVVADKNPRSGNNFFIDYDNPGVRRRPLSAASPEARAAINDWFAWYAPNPFAFGLSLLLTLVYYGLFFPVAWLLRKILRR